MFRSTMPSTPSVSLADAPESKPKAAREPAHADDHRHGLRERQPDGGRPVERRVVFRAALDPVPVRPDSGAGTQLQIWHASHGRFETESPVRTFVPYTISGQQYILAAYTCTPLVKIPVSDLKPGAKVQGFDDRRSGRAAISRWTWFLTRRMATSTS